MMRCGFVCRGRVQGVGFRWFTKRAADARHVAGWVRNESDGTVAGEAEGEDAAVAAFLDDLRRGPRMSCVDDVAVHPVQAIGDSGFAIR